MASTDALSFFATSPKGLELLLVDELRHLGAENVAEKLAGVAFTGGIEIAYKACLWSRLANRILLNLAQVPALTPEALYAGVQTINWDNHIDPDATLAVHCVCSQSQINHTLFAAQKVKDAIVDQIRNKHGQRPNVAKDQPDVSVYVYIYRNEAFISLDLSGDSLHKRGYRLAGGSAPLKENLAAAILFRAQWPEIAKEGGSLLDPMCGSGTLLIEGALMAADIAPGLARTYFGFLGWKQFNKAYWDTLVADAKTRREQGLTSLPTIIGYDQDPDAINIAFQNIERAGFKGKIHVEKRPLSVFAPPSQAKTGLIVVNPPYGERLGEVESLQPLYTELGARFKDAFVGWKAAVFTGNPDLGKQMGLRAEHYYALFNGAIPCKLLLFTIEPAIFVDRSPEGENERRIRTAQRAVKGELSASADMFINRLRKNLKHIKRQAMREGKVHYTVYDADLPEYAFLIEVTEKGIEVTEYQAPKTVDKAKAMYRQQEVLAYLPELLEVSPAQIYFRILARGRK